MIDSRARQGLERAVKAAGGSSALTRALGCSPSVVGNWRREGGIPAARVPAVSDVTGLAPHDLRPDLFSASRRAEAGPAGFAETQSAFRDEARALGLDADAIAAAALRDAIRTEKARRWQEENREAIEEWNAWTERNELPLAKYRMF